MDAVVLLTVAFASGALSVGLSFCRYIPKLVEDKELLERAIKNQRDEIASLQVQNASLKKQHERLEMLARAVRQFVNEAYATDDDDSEDDE